MAEDNKYMEKILKEVIVATSNKGKFEEIKRMLESVGIRAVMPERKIDVEESGNTFLENAYIKAKAYYEAFKKPVLADDSGIIAEALEPYPGIFSSRFYSIEFGGKEEPIPDKDRANIRKLLRLLEGKGNRRARFEAFIVLLIDENRGIFSRGICKGEIVKEPRGEKGFGYDPVFLPEGETRTMAELDPSEKDQLSHRGKALRSLLSILKVL